MPNEMTMVERVAKAVRTYGIRIWGKPHMYAVIGPESFDKPLTGMMEHAEALAEADRLNALAVLEAMREPTVRMELAAEKEDLDGRAGPAAHWRSMIDDAVSEGRRVLTKGDGA